MNEIRRLTDRITFWLGVLGAIGIGLMMIHVTVDVLLRQFLRIAVPATGDIVTRYYMILLAFVPLGWLEQREEMIRVEVLDAFVSGVVDRVLTLCVNLVLVVAYVGLAWLTLGEAMDALHTGSYVVSLGHKIPVWPGYFFPPIGFLVAAFVLLVRIVAPTPPHSNIKRLEPINEH